MVTAAFSKVFRLLASGVLSVALLAGCGGGGGGGGSGPYTIGGSISSLVGTVVLQINGGELLSRAANGSFSFPTALASGASYNVTVQSQPATQNCTVTSGSGTATANVTNVAVACTVKTYTLGGTVNGLTGSLVLVEENEAYSLLLTSSGSYQFVGKVEHGDPYGVSIFKQPLGQNCTVASGATGTATANISNVVVNCVDSPYTVSGTVSGLTSGTMVLQLNLANNLTVGNGSFTFPKPLAAGTPYVVSILGSSQTTHACTAAASTGTAIANVTNVAFNCTPLAANLPVGGVVQGLAGSVVLRNSLSGENITLNANGNFTFPTAVARGADYFVTVQTQPSGQTCVVNGATAPVSTSSAVGLRVVCAAGTETRTVGGTVSGLKAPLKLAINLNNAVLDVAPSGSGPVAYTFPVPLPFDAEFSVGVREQPAGQICALAHSGGHVPHANVTDIAVTCVDNVTDLLSGTYTTVGGGFAFTFYGSGIYVFASVDDDPACGASKGSGVEMGAYRYNAAAGTLTLASNVLDTNGSAVGCGVWQGGASIVSGAFTKTGTAQDTVLTLTPTNGSPPVALVPVASVANRPIGSFFVLGGNSFLLLQPDGHYLEANTNNDPGSNAPAGIEYGCYALSGTNTGTLTPTISTTTCAGAVDTDNTAGLSGSAGTAIPYNSGPGFLVLDGGEVVLLRVLPY